MEYVVYYLSLADVVRHIGVLPSIITTNISAVLHALLLEQIDPLGINAHGDPERFDDADVAEW